VHLSSALTPDAFDYSPDRLAPNPVLCASAASRLIWAGAALVMLWTTVLWALD
jgi:hypothetical protein